MNKNYHQKSANINIRDQLASVIHKELNFDDALVTLAKMEASPDLRYLKVWVSVMPEKKSPNVLKQLQKNAKDLSRKLVGKIKIKYIPKISFLSDIGQKNYNQVEEIIAKLHAEKEISTKTKKAA